MDEVANVIQEMNLGPKDLKILLNNKNLCHVNEETKQLIWDDEDYDGTRFADIKRKAIMGSVYVLRDTVFFWTFPVKIFNAFKKVFVLTYKYTGQIQSAYYKFFKIPIKYIHIETYLDKENNKVFNFIDELFNEPQKCNTEQYKKLINICQNEDLNKIGNIENSTDKNRLSKTWYTNNKSNESGLLNIIKENTIRYFHGLKNSTAKNNMWTCFKDFQDDLKGPRYNNGFISCNMRATNEYINKSNLAYLINYYLNPVIKNFFLQKSISIDEDEYALSEMLQWIFRSRIRKLEPINIYIPSQRMRELLINWE